MVYNSRAYLLQNNLLFKCYRLVIYLNFASYIVMVYPLQLSYDHV